MILKYSADEARNLKSYGEMLISIFGEMLIISIFLGDDFLHYQKS